MMTASRKDPWAIPEWHAIGRESTLVRHLVGSGATALGRANYADKVGEYYTAFFGLSVGMERLAKLILVVDHAISNNGRMPEEKIFRKFGHKLLDLMNAAEVVAEKYKLKLDYSRPVDAVSVKIIECLDAFADASRGRYANFATLGDPNFGREEPIRRWWGHVADLILKEHYYGKPIQYRVETRAKLIDETMSSFIMVLHTSETGEKLDNLLSASIRTGQTDIVQRYGRYYALTIVRWLAEIFSVSSREAAYTHGIGALFGMWEYFQSYRVDDVFLKTRKVWPLK